MTHRISRPARLSAIAALATTLAPAAPAQAQQTWTEQTTAAVMGYCMARHPYIPRPAADPFTAEGFEILASPGVLGAVRRNYVHRRGPPLATDPDAGATQSCKDACFQFGLNYGTQTGRPLHYRHPDGRLEADGVGDIASLGYRDHDFYAGQNVIAGMWGRPRNYHESDVAQADLCCCQLDASAPPPPTRACVEFEQPLIVGTRFGVPQGQSPGDLAFVENGITVTLETFQSAGGNTFFNEAYVDALPVPGGATQSLRSNNIALRFDFSGLGYAASAATFYYLDFGGSEHLAANDDAPLAGELSGMAGAMTGGTAIDVIPGAVTNSSRAGQVVLKGAIKALTIGGQELWIDRVCAEP